MTAGEFAAILESRGLRVRHRGAGLQAQCPAHDDRKRKRALSVSPGRDGRRLMHCHAGCSFDDVRVALGLPPEAFFGWDAFRRERLRRSSPAHSVTLIISGVRVLDAKRLLKGYDSGEIAPVDVRLSLPPHARHVTRAVAEDMALLFGLADGAGVGGVPLMYSARWASGRLGITEFSSVSAALRALQQHGAIVRAKCVPSWHGRATRTYRRAS